MYLRRPACLIASLCLMSLAPSLAAAAGRFEAESAMVDSNLVQKTADAAASGGYYVNMKDGALAFKVEMAAAGFYTLWATYSQPYDAAGKIQNLAVNGVARGQISFPYVASFTRLKASSKLKLEAGANTIEIQKSWGWVNIDFVELSPYEAAPFNVAPALANPKASGNARKVYSFLRGNFGKKAVSGFMTNTVMANDGKYTPNTVETQAEAVWIKAAAGKLPALMGVDFMHSTGLNSEQDWYKGYTNATLALAEEIFRKGGIPTYTWHWKDPSKAVETFYSPSSGNTPSTTFDLAKACADSTCAAWNTASPEYLAIVRDLDLTAANLKILAGKGVPVIWRPLHEASGRWFWWGYKGPKACKALYRLMYDRFTGMHGLDNLIWSWVTDEASDAGDWYPGDAYVDIVGRDYYYYPRIANHGSLVASFEKVKDLFGGTKLIALTENGSIPHPDSMAADGAGWSYFMPWYGDYTMDGWAHDNTAADWKSILNHPYVLTLDGMPGWENVVVGLGDGEGARVEGAAAFRMGPGWLELSAPGAGRISMVELFDARGTRVAALKPLTSGFGTGTGAGATGDKRRRFALEGIRPGIYQARASLGDGALRSARIAVTGP
jgi:mannan endo-1,4-beta-mannosidase